ncbi:hypothetical protein J6590_077132 [Homalodisca vitripennis]|nr:hypothetical protein J6590_077132 [Homalodisca vitripennis]
MNAFLEGMVREVESGDYLSTDHMDRFGSILDENTEYHPVSCLAIDAMEGVSAVATPHIQILFSGKIDASSIVTSNNDFENLYSELSDNTCLDYEEPPPSLDILSKALLISTELAEVARYPWQL